MVSKRKVSEEAIAMLTREATVRDMVPEFKENRDKQEITRMIAEHTVDDPLNVIENYNNCVFDGVTPPPNILAFIAEWFARYLDSSGNKTLDYAFDLKPKQKASHPIKHRKIKEKRGIILLTMWSMREKAKESGKRLSIPKAAEKALEEFNINKPTVDALDREYRDSGIQRICDRAKNALTELEKFRKK